MFEILIQQFLPQLAKILAFFIIFISGYTIINLKGGIPTRDNRIISKVESLIVICIGGGFLLLIAEPILEVTILSILYQYISFALPIALLLCGIALLKFDEKMTWDYSKYGWVCIIIAILWIVFILIL